MDNDAGPVIQNAVLVGRVQVIILYEDQLSPKCDGEVLFLSPPNRRLVAFGADHSLMELGEVWLADLAGHPGMFVAEEPPFQRTPAEFAAAGVEPNVPW